MKGQPLGIVLLMGLLGAAAGTSESAAELAEGLARAGEPAPNDVKKPQPIVTDEAGIQKVLAQPTELEFVETPLSDVIDYLKDVHKIEIQLDTKSLEEAGAGTDTPVTRNLKGISLRSALNLMLKSFDLTHVVKNEVLLITTPDAADQMFETRVYDLNDLVDPSDVKIAAGKLESLTDTIRSTIRPESWSNKCGLSPCGLRSYVDAEIQALVVRQTINGHNEISDLLTSLRNLKRHGVAAHAP